jgi:DNA-binding response OmpR family regulator
MSDPPLILVADDDADLRALVAYRLESAGYEVLQAVDGQQAVDLAFERTPDVVVLDLMMPKLDGYEVARRLRADERTLRVPVILLTSRSQERDVAAGFDAGANDYVTKPFSPAELQARVRAMLARPS